jgi:hypothetical protein
MAGPVRAFQPLPDLRLGTPAEFYKALSYGEEASAGVSGWK